VKTYWPGSTKDIVVYDAARAAVTSTQSGSLSGSRWVPDVSGNIPAHRVIIPGEPTGTYMGIH